MNYIVRNVMRIAGVLFFCINIMNSNTYSLATGYSGGTGDISNPYLISSVEDLNNLRLQTLNDNSNVSGKYYMLTTDLDLKDFDTDDNLENGNWEPIGVTSAMFSGYFDGGGHVVRNMTIVRPDSHVIGLFGRINGATLKDLGIESSSVTGEHAGLLVGYAENSSRIERCYSLGVVEGTQFDIGGLVGKLYTNSVLVDSYSGATVFGEGNFFGGLVGYVTTNSIVETSYSTGSVYGSNKNGGLIGNLNSSKIINSYWDIEASGVTASDGGKPLTTQNMQFKESLSYMKKFQFDSIWKINSTYPVLNWQYGYVDECEDLVKFAETDKGIDSLTVSRNHINNLPESSKKDELQERLNAISPNVSFDIKTVSANLDIYIKSENMLSLSLDTNSVNFDDFSGVEDEEKQNAVNLTVSSSLPYTVKAYLANEIQNADKSKTMDKSILNIKANSESAYETFSDTVTPIVLLDNQIEGDNMSHGIDLKLKGNIAHEKDVYKTTIKIEVEQK